MRVATYYSNNDIRIEDVSVPQISPGELLIRVEASGICGTDVLEWYRRDKIPLVLGHEIAGQVQDVGSGLIKYKKGQRITASHHVPCGKCTYCLRGHQTVCQTLRQTHFDPGGFCEYLRIPKINVELGGIYPLPENLSYVEATFTEPLACVWRAQRLAEMSAGKSVLVMGCGVSGILHIQLAQINGASFIAACDIEDYRLKLAQCYGVTLAVNTRREDVIQCFRQSNQGKGADLVVVATGAKSAHIQALQAVEPGGCILFFAATAEGMTIPLSINEVFWRKEITFVSSYAATPEEHVEAINLLSKGKIKVKDMITHRLGLDSIEKGFQLVAKAQDSLKVIIEPQR
jgi:L-iditol 2-dehydrogenase